MDDRELEVFLKDIESDRVERKASITERNKIRQAVCAFAKDLPFDIQPVHSATLEDLDFDLFRLVYLPSSVSVEIIEENDRPIADQLTSLRFAAVEPQFAPTVLGILVSGKDPAQFLPGAYIQFLRIDGLELTDPIKDQKEIGGPLPDQLKMLDETLQINISTASDITSKPIETRHPDYPIVALQQLARNAVMHRTYIEDRQREMFGKQQT